MKRSLGSSWSIIEFDVVGQLGLGNGALCEELSYEDTQAITYFLAVCHSRLYDGSDPNRELMPAACSLS